MVHLSICASLNVDAESYKRLIGSIFSYNKGGINIKKFINPKMLLSKIQELKTDHIIFLILRAGDSHWLDMAKQIKRFRKKIQFIIISNNSNYAIHGYKIKAYDYLLEPISKMIIRKTLYDLFSTSQVCNDITVCIDREKVNLNLDDIIYFECLNRKIVAHSKTDNYNFYGIFYDIERDTMARNFLRCHQSYIVNLKHIHKHTKSSVTMIDSKICIPISRKYCESFLRGYKAYYNGRLGGQESQLQCLLCNKKVEME